MDVCGYAFKLICWFVYIVLVKNSFVQVTNSFVNTNKAYPVLLSFLL